MYIMKRPSHGRGEYEVAEAHGGFLASDLIDHVLTLVAPPFPDRPTGLEVKEQGGKPRLRRIATTNIQIQRQLAVLCLLPKPIRDETALNAHHGGLLRNGYIIRKAGIAALSMGMTAEIRIGPVELDLGGGSLMSVSLPDRLTRLAVVFEQLDSFPAAILTPLRAVKTLLESGEIIYASAEVVVADLIDALPDWVADADSPYTLGADPLPFLEVLGHTEPRPLPPDVSLSPAAPPEVRLREAMRWRRWAAARGSKGVQFRRAVRRAYRDTCVVCGLELPAGPGLEVAGVDAAHILPWAAYDLDVIANGLCLCKLHHWAFDQQVIVIEFREGQYHTRVTTTAKHAFAKSPSTLAALASVEGVIPASRLPSRASDLPSPALLQRLYQDVPAPPSAG